MWENVCANLMRQTRVPDLVVVARDERVPQNIPFPPTTGFGLIVWSAPAANHYGKSHNENVEQVTRVYNEGLVCNMDDDDWYGADYLAEAERVMLSHADAWMVGKAECWVRWIGGRRDGQREWSSGQIAHDGKTTGVAGMTIGVNLAQWIAHPEWRFRETLDDDVQLQAQCLALGGSIYHHEGEFVAQRYGDPEHAHSWNNPRDHW